MGTVLELRFSQYYTVLYIYIHVKVSLEGFKMFFQNKSAEEYMFLTLPGKINTWVSCFQKVAHLLYQAL